MGSIVAVVKGGLGNQLFIYAAARALALRTGRRLYLDVGSYARDTFSRTFRLDRFPIEAAIADVPVAGSGLRAWRYRQLRSFNKLLPLSWRSHIKEAVDPRRFAVLAPRRATVIVDGYWQDEDYFADHAVQVRRELAPPAPVDNDLLRLGDRLAACDSAFVHVRRRYYRYLLSPDYYQRAIDRICGRLTRPCFLAVGDDPEWMSRNLDFHGHTVETGSPDGDELSDLWLMSRCRNAIIANSSFSWWGAWLQNGEGESTVFAPAQTGLRLAMPARWQRVSNVVTPAPDGGAF